jgi:hypothetical protein
MKVVKIELVMHEYVRTRELSGFSAGFSHVALRGFSPNLDRAPVQIDLQTRVIKERARGLGIVEQTRRAGNPDRLDQYCIALTRCRPWAGDKHVQKRAGGKRRSE